MALRPEPFGALAYHFGNRKLTFLKRPELVAVVRGLASSPTSARALRRPPASRRGQHPAYASALRGLAATDMIRRREAAEDRMTAVQARPQDRAARRAVRATAWTPRSA